jgi:hypothetical protein
MLQVAITMVEKLGMSPKIGIVSYGGGGGGGGRGRRGGSDRGSASEETRAAIDQEVKRLTDESYRRAKKLLKNKLGELHALAETLLDRETLTGEEASILSVDTVGRAFLYIRICVVARTVIKMLFCLYIFCTKLYISPTVCCMLSQTEKKSYCNCLFW